MNEGELTFAIYLMAAREFRPPVRLILQSNEKGLFMKLAAEETYLVQDDLEQNLGLVKVYAAEGEEEEETIKKVIHGIKFMTSLGLKTSDAASPLDFEKAKVDTDEKPYIALFTIPEGKALHTHIQYLSNQKRATLERVQAYEMLKNGYQKLAIALAELHTKKFSPLCTISRYYWEFHMDTCRDIVKGLKIYADELPFNLIEFSDKLIKMAAAAYVNPCSAAFLHGSPIAGSIVYEPFSDVLSMLDMEECYHSIDDKGMPCGPNAYDYVWAMASFELQMTAIDAPHDEIHDIIEIFKNTYKSAVLDRFPSEQHLSFYNVLFWLPIFKQLFTRYDGREGDMKSAERRIFRLARTRIEAVLKEGSK